MVKKYVLMQIGCPECKTETKVVGYYDNIELAATLLDSCNRELESNPRKVEFKVLQLPELNKVDEYYKQK